MTLDDIHTRLSQNAAQQQLLLDAFRDAIAASDKVKQAAAQRQLAKLQSEMQRLSNEQQHKQFAPPRAVLRPRARATGKTIREQVLDILDEIGVPLSPATISEFSQATTGVDIPASRFASMRRDEDRSSLRDINARPAWIAPALNAEHLSQIPRLVTSSAWPAERRIIGARSLRVSHLLTTLAFLDRFERLKAAHSEYAHAMESLLLRYARGVPGAVASSSPPEPEKIRQVVKTELGAIEADDVAERRNAAGRLNKYNARQQLMGLMPSIEGCGTGRVAG